ncbi:MAG: RagB/SusD family nutrient uptake outer membrane protein [Chitinophagaceae bacterium]|nr:RagB/SusD family nutrient uptake outer membrane protein [Chitinophagaceae bacterium]
MKQFKFKYILLLTVIGFTSCNKGLLDTVPNDRLSEDLFWKSQNDVLLALNSLYRDLDGTNIFAWDALTDIGHVNQPFAIDAYIANGTYDATSSKILSEWSNAYTGIAAVNYFLENADNVTITDAAAQSRYKAEARFLRVYQYVKLTTLYGAVPLITGTISIADARTIQKEELSKLYDFINSELAEIAPLLPLAYAGADKGRITRGAALALKARSNLYAGRYADAATDAKAVIELNTYSLYPEYGKLFSYAAENNGEVILDKQFIASSYSNNVFNLLAPYSQKSSQSTYVPTKKLVDKFQTKDGLDITDPASGYDAGHPYINRDPRLGFSVFLDGDALPGGGVFHPAPNSGTADAVGNTYIASTTGFNVKKYINTEDFANPSNNGINIILIRYAEVLLTYAEAKIEAGDIDQSVYDAINTVRNGRNDVKLPSITTGSTQAELREIVRRERTVELAFEGLHLADIRRWKTAAAVVHGAVYGITYEDGGVFKTIQVAVNREFIDPKHYLWPIPQTETVQNPNLTQNLNW